MVPRDLGRLLLASLLPQQLALVFRYVLEGRDAIAIWTEWSGAYASRIVQLIAQARASVVIPG